MVYLLLFLLNFKPNLNLNQKTYLANRSHISFLPLLLRKESKLDFI